MSPVDFKRWMMAQPRLTASCLILVGLFGYLLGVELPLVLVVVTAVAVFMPMPSVFSSMISRIFVALFFLYSLLQLAAMIQLFVHPEWGFKWMAVLLSLTVIGLIWQYGSDKPNIHLPAFNFKDLCVVAGCLLFIIPFVPIIRGRDSVQRIAQMGGIQVIDAVVHYGSTVSYTEVQTLRHDYRVGSYYPSGFHIATGFVEHTILGDVRDRGWTVSALLYFGQYMFLGLLLAAAMIYFGFVALEALGAIADKLSLLSVALTIGAGTTIMHLWAFIDLGFLNYFYVAAAILIASCYVLERRLEYSSQDGAEDSKQRYAWPIGAFLLVGFGASFSWPLLAPVFLLSAGLFALLPLRFEILRKKPVGLAWISLPLFTIAGLHVAAIYIQSIYMRSNLDLVLMAGALQNFNILLLLVGLGVTLVVVKSFEKLAERLLVLVVPYLILVGLLMALHYFKLGLVHYYVIKCSLLLEMLFLSIGTVALAHAVRRLKVHALVRLLVVPSIVLFVVIATMGSVPQPFQEIRSLFRTQSGAGIPPFFESDVNKIVHLGTEQKLHSFNMTILHYDASGNRFFAHIEPALWANTMAPFQVSDIPLAPNTPLPRPSCFGTQLDILAYGSNRPLEQEILKKAVRECMASAAQSRLPYYIVTDGASVSTLRQTFGDGAQYVF